MRTIYIIHGWTGTPQNDWLPWLKKELEKRDWKVVVPEMPNTDAPVIGERVNHLQNVVKELNKDVFFIGHSIGCQAIMRYLLTKDEAKVGGLVCVAGFFTLQNLESKEEERIAKPWLEIPIDFNRVKKAIKNIVAIFSDNDPWVPFDENTNLFKKRLDAKVIKLHNKGHFSQDDGITKEATILQAILDIV